MEHESTFELKRQCQHCGKPIADHVHAARKHCPRIELDNGRIVNCKDRFHSRKNKPLNEPFKYMAKWQRYYHYRIRMLYDNEGEMVTLEHINRYGINLHRPFEFKIMTEKRYVFYYHEFAIEQLPDSKYKIIKHGLF